MDLIIGLIVAFLIISVGVMLGSLTALKYFLEMILTVRNGS